MFSNIFFVLLCFHSEVKVADDSKTDWIAIIACIASAISLIISFVTVIQRKRTEIRYAKFEKLCLNIIDDKFNEIKKFLTETGKDSLTLHLDKITMFYVDLVIITITLQKIYPRIDIDHIQNECNVFTDFLYTDPSKQIFEINQQYLESKLKILNKLYDYALYEEIKLFKWK